MDAKIPKIERQMTKPDFSKIFRDMAAKKNIDITTALPQKKSYSSMDVININEKFFSTKTKESLAFNQSHRAYDEASIKEMLEYQKQYNLTNAELSNHFKLSTTTISKWKKLYK